MLKKVSKIKKLTGNITIPADKSISHRAIMLSSIAKGDCIIKNVSKCADCWSTLNLFRNLGIEIKEINSNSIQILSKGTLKQFNKPLDVGNSGTTIRLVTGILAGQNFNSVLIGDESLSKRPMQRIIEPLTLMGANIKSINKHAPLTIRGKKLHGIEYTSALSSAQVKSCVLLAGLNAEGKTTYIEPFVSRNHTELLLKYLGAEILVNDNKTTVSQSQLISKNIEIVGDISSAAFFIVAGLIVEGSDFIIRNLGINPTRTGILDVVKRMGGNIEVFNNREICGELCADIRVQYTENLNGCEISGEDIPRLIDELPVVAVLATQAEGETIIKDAGDLRNKESDRISCLVNELKKLGVDIEELEDGFVIRKSKLKGDVELNCYCDHRLAMSFYIAGLICEKEISIKNFEWVQTSFPEFEELLSSLN